MRSKRGEISRRRIFRFVASWTREHGFPPSIREICHGLGFASTKAVKHHLDTLVHMGVLRRYPKRARGLTVSQPAGLPVLGRIAAGKPLAAPENYEGDFSLNDYRDCFLLRVKGDSMSGVGIRDSDLVIVRPQEMVQSGEIAAVVIDQEATIKRFRLSGKRILLCAENPNYAPVELRPGEHELRIIGKVVGLLRLGIP